MGAIFSWFRRKSNQQQQSPKVEEEAPKQYSWDKLDRSKAQDFIIQDLKGETVGRMPGTVNGEQMIIQNCQDCNIYIFDYSATITIDDCTNCNIVIGPVKQSLFIRDCLQCRFVLACQQFRTRDCRHIDVFFLCESQPIIESSSKMRFACYKYSYPELEGQFRNAGLSIFNNNWSNIHDFTPVPDEGPNLMFLPEDAKVEEFVPLPQSEPLSTVQVSTTAESSLVPQTLGKRRKPSDESCFMAFFYDTEAEDRAINFLNSFTNQDSGFVLVQARELLMQPQDAARVFGDDSFAEVVTHGPVIGMEVCGDGVMDQCQQFVAEKFSEPAGLVYVSDTMESTQLQIHNYFSFADMEMGL